MRIKLCIYLPFWLAVQAGWALLVGKEVGVLECRAGGYWDARYYGDSGASLAVLQAGWNLASLMTRYQGVDWRDEANWGCNERCGAGLETGRIHACEGWWRGMV